MLPATMFMCLVFCTPAACFWSDNWQDVSLLIFLFSPCFPLPYTPAKPASVPSSPSVAKALMTIARAFSPVASVISTVRHALVGSTGPSLGRALSEVCALVFFLIIVLIVFSRAGYLCPSCCPGPRRLFCGPLRSFYFVFSCCLPLSLPLCTKKFLITLFLSSPSSQKVVPFRWALSSRCLFSLAAPTLFACRLGSLPIFLRNGFESPVLLGARLK